MAMGISMVFRWFSSFLLTVPKALTTISITVALTYHSFCTCDLKYWYLVIFFQFFHFDVLISKIIYFDDFAFSLLFTMTTISGLRCSISLSVWIANSQNIMGHSLTMWLTVLSALLQVLYFVCPLDLSMFPLIHLVWMACSLAAHIMVSISRFRVPFFNHYHLFWFPTSLFCPANWPWNWPPSFAS